MLQFVVQFVEVGLGIVSLAGLVNVTYKILSKTKPRNHIPRGRRKKTNDPAIEFFKTVNPYCQGMIYAYSAFKHLNQQHDPIAYVGTAFAIGEFVYDYTLRTKALNRLH